MDEVLKAITDAKAARGRLFVEIQNAQAEGRSDDLPALNRSIAEADTNIERLEAEYGRAAATGRTKTDGGIGRPLSDLGLDARNLPTDTGDVVERRDTRRAPNETRDQAQRTIERYAGSMDTGAADRLDVLVRKDDARDWVSRYVAAVGSPEYASAFGKLAADPQFGHLRFSPAEVEAVRITSAVDAERSMAIGSGASGGFLLPFQLDPTVMLSSSGSLNPIRRLARVETVSANVWKGVSSDGVTAQYRAEGATMTDNSPTLAQPTVTAARWDAFVPYSWELGQDDPSLVGELVRLIADGRDQLESTKFYSGSGTAEPRGVMIGLSATQRVASAGSTVFAYADIWNLKAAVPARFIDNTTIVAHPKTFDTAYQFVGGNSTSPLQFDSGRGGAVVGLPKAEWSSVGTQWTTTSGTIAIAGDFRSGYLIADRLGLTAIPVPVLFSGNTAGGFGYPTGQSGLIVWGRTGADVVNANALRALVVS